MCLAKVVHEVAITVVFLSWHVNISDLQFKVQRKVGAVRFPLLKSVALICFQTHGSNYRRS